MAESIERTDMDPPVRRGRPRELSQVVVEVAAHVAGVLVARTKRAGVPLTDTERAEIAETSAQVAGDVEARLGR